jgi:SP family sugar:H+ symporter-like MFS transporter
LEGLQFVLPVFFICGLHLIPESPRWYSILRGTGTDFRLISKGRHEEALKSLSQLRTHAASNPQALQSEIALMENVESNQKKAPWRTMFSKRNRRRTGVAIGVMLGQQLTGQAFFSQYSTFFYKEQGYSDPFLLSVIGSVIGVVFGITAMFLVDHVGRRYSPSRRPHLIADRCS